MNSRAESQWVKWPLMRAKANSFPVIILIATVLIALSFSLRIGGLEARALTIDEATIASFVEGVLDKGYPYIYVSTMEVPLATYELVPYFLALSVKLGGFSEFTLRLPALLFSTGVLSLIFWISLRRFGLAAAIIAGLLYSLSTWSIYWSQNAFHPAQTQFFTLLTATAVYHLLQQERVRLRFALLVWALFTVTYLSWEGSGFLLPVMAVIVLIFKRDNLVWIFQRNLWVMYLLVILTLVAQGVRRVVLQQPHLMLGSGKGDVSLPQLGFLKDSWEPGFYFINFFGMETHLITGAIFLLGAYYAWKRPTLRFYYLVFLITLLCLSNFLLFYNAHYVFFIYPFFIISVGAILTFLIEDVTRLTSRVKAPAATAVASFNLAALLLMAVMSMNSNLIHFYSIGNLGHLGFRSDYRDGFAGVDYRKVSATLKQGYREGDKVISMAPMPTKLYSGITPDYFLQTITDRKIVYDRNLDSPFYRDKFLGTVVLRSDRELQDVLNQNNRVWLVASPWNAMTLVIDADTLQFVQRSMRVVDESYDARLFLWQK
ncbi:hypothetical protein EUZ85_29230 [Hahella sp. KA22]|uniref:glycosyltransferase family 39 protein n=1 Tax=Hahella sp. KA22 TaxID=1628392 RepID=UPI000FDEF8E5|nr:glycosyltransferase family 39 protein [Hahella sp. KA22]AZZ94580.1 hypothetical protein ENC22_26645 [Hahella sp. KA22]QAY57953.1 hypothetical protein EUZ85_29230 [Hahella sp. KA22]